MSKQEVANIVLQEIKGWYSVFPNTRGIDLTARLSQKEDRIEIELNARKYHAEVFIPDSDDAQISKEIVRKIVSNSVRILDESAMRAGYKIL